MPPSSNLQAFSPTMSTASSVAGHGKVMPSRIVHKLAVEGHCRTTTEGATLRLYMKIVLPLEGLTAGASIPLFPEENLRIVNSKVHPLDSGSTPYAFSSSAVPLLHRTARALNLPDRSSKSYFAFLGIPPPALVSPSEMGPRRSNNSAPLPVTVTGEINVSNFHICFILPKILPTRAAVAADNEHEVPNGMSSRARRQTFTDRNTIMFMAGAEIFVPFLSRPPKAPFQLSVPLPRCLSNHIKLRMPPPTLPSGQEARPWDLSSEPVVTYQPLHRPRVAPYGYLPDDEQSPSDDGHSSSSTGTTAGIQGTFPSTDRIRIRWAAPLDRHQGYDALADGRHMLGVDTVNGQLRSTIMGQDKEGRTRLKLDYEGTCSGLWFPGVATHLGMEVVLDAKGRPVAWEGDGGWDVTGGTGFTGFDAGPAVETEESSGRPRRDSGIRPQMTPSRPSSYASASLLRTHMPNSSLLPDYSFETTPSPTASMLNSAASPYFTSAETPAVISDRGPPLQPIGLHINIGDLPPPPRNEFNFRIRGSILLGPPEDPEDDESVLVLPVFRVVSADKDNTELVVASDVADGVEVIMPQDRRHGRAPTRRLLRKKTEIRAQDGVAIALELPPTTGSTPVKQPANGTPARGKFDEPKLPILQRRSFVRIESPVRPSRSSSLSSLATGPYPIPWVRAQVTMLPQSEAYSHSVHFVVPSVAASRGILSFGVCLPSFLISETKASIDVVWATADGRRLSVEVFPRVPLVDESNEDLEEFERTLQLIDFKSGDEEEQEKQGGVDDLGLRDLVSWIQIRLPEGGVTGNVEANYLIGRDSRPATLSKRRGRDETSLLLPCFHVGVGTYTIEMDTPLDYEFPLVVSNFHQQTGGRLVHHKVPGYFYPRVKARLRPIRIASSWSPTSIASTGVNATVGFALCLALLWTIFSLRWMMLSLQQDVHELKRIIAASHASRTPGLGSSEGSWADVYAWPPEGHPTHVSAGPVASPRTEFPYHATPGLLPTPYPAHPGSAELTVIRNILAMVPAIPLTILHNLDWKSFTDALLSAFDKAFDVFKVVLNYPLPP